jgi:putative membrane protein|tara:strand:- start:1229 stop:1585 length:357 start_codon:yes stop_codon:yes gene_type:complete
MLSCRSQEVNIVYHLLILSFVIVLVAEVVPGIRLKGFGTAVAVAVVYSLVNVVLGSVLRLLSLPLIFLTLGLFLLIINTLMLWLTNLLIEDFEIRDMQTTFIAALLISVADFLLDLAF